MRILIRFIKLEKDTWLNREKQRKMRLRANPLKNKKTFFFFGYVQCLKECHYHANILPSTGLSSTKTTTTIKGRQKDKLSISFFIVFHRLIVVWVSFCSLIKGVTPKIRMLCFVLINSVTVLNLLCVWIMFCSEVENSAPGRWATSNEVETDDQCTSTGTTYGPLGTGRGREPGSL